MDIGVWGEDSRFGNKLLRPLLKQLKSNGLGVVHISYFRSQSLSFCHVRFEVSVVGF